MGDAESRPVWEPACRPGQQGRAPQLNCCRAVVVGCRRSTSSYKDGTGAWKSLRPDFLFFSEANGQVEVSIVDPHGHHLADAMPKLRGLAHYADTYGDDFLRIEAVARVGDTLKVLDLKQERVRRAVLAGTDAKTLYQGDSADDY